ncbi:MAG: Crp/Fnr family transcriptional regulator [Anaerovoracaceae bacterium]
MKKHLKLIENTLLFREIKEEEIEAMLGCLSYTFHSYKKGETILHQGDNLDAIGMVLSGRVHILKEDFWGNRAILTEVSVGEIFGETYACIQGEALGVNVVCAEACEILFLNVNRIMTICSASCQFHTKLISNLLSVMAEKNLMLTKKMEHMAKRTTREKLMSYLSAQSLKGGKTTFKIPFNRQQLADYLSVDRSAMSAELSKLQAEGYIRYEKNQFTLEEQD